jgi:hypothetical protein
VDAIPIGHSLTYAFNTSRLKRTESGNINQSLIIELDVSQGNPSLYVNCDTYIKDIKDRSAFKAYKWSTTNRGKEVLLISQHELQDFPSKCEMMYLTVYAEVCAAFSLDLHRQTEISNDTYIPIQPGISEKGYIEGHEQVAYLLSLPKSDVSSVTVRLSSVLGNPDLYIQECGTLNSLVDNIFGEKYKPQCTILPFDDIFMMDPEKAKDLIGKSESVGDDQITFRHDPAELKVCKNSLGPDCHYVIVIYPNAGNATYIEHTVYNL